MQISSFDPNTAVFAHAAIAPGDTFHPNADAKISVPIPFTHKSWTNPWPADAVFDKVDPHTMVWREWLTRPIPGIHSFSSEVTLQQNGGDLEMTMRSKLDGIPVTAKRGYHILSSDEHALRLEDIKTGQVCVSEFTPTGLTGKDDPKYTVNFDWVLPLGMHVVKTGSTYGPSAVATVPSSQN